MTDKRKIDSRINICTQIIDLPVESGTWLQREAGDGKEDSQTVRPTGRRSQIRSSHSVLRSVRRQAGRHVLKEKQYSVFMFPFVVQKSLLSMGRVVLVSLWPWAAVGRGEDTALSIAWGTSCYRFQRP